MHRGCCTQLLYTPDLPAPRDPTMESRSTLRSRPGAPKAAWRPPTTGSR